MGELKTSQALKLEGRAKDVAISSNVLLTRPSEGIWKTQRLTRPSEGYLKFVLNKPPGHFNYKTEFHTGDPVAPPVVIFAPTFSNHRGGPLNAEKGPVGVR